MIKRAYSRDVQRPTQVIENSDGTFTPTVAVTGRVIKKEKLFDDATIPAGTTTDRTSANIPTDTKYCVIYTTAEQSNLQNFVSLFPRSGQSSLRTIDGDLFLALPSQNETRRFSKEIPFNSGFDQIRSQWRNESSDDMTNADLWIVFLRW